MSSEAAPCGRVVGLFRKPEVPGERGLPKRPETTIRVDPNGVEGDFNRWRQEERRGDPDLALLLLPRETIDELNAQGWPVRPGDFGENILTEGVDYADLGPPHMFRIGGVTAEISKACDPCNNLYLLPYVGSVKGPDFVRTMIGRRGWYARVLEPGEIRVGDPLRRLR